MSCLKRVLTGDHARVAAAALAGMLFSPYFFGSYYVPFIMKKADPGLFPGDFFVGSMGVYNSAYFWAMGLVARYLDLRLITAIMYLCVICATAVLVFELALTLFGGKRTAYAAVFLLLLPKCAVSVAFAGIERQALEPSTFAGVFLLWAVLLFIKGRLRPACLLVSFMFYVQGMEAFITAVMFLFYLVSGAGEVSRREAAVCSLLLAVPALPMAASVFSGGFLGAASSPGDTERWLEILHVRSWYHLFPFSWGPGDWFNYSGWFIWAFVAFGRGRPLHPVVKRFLAAVAAMCALSTVFSELFPVPLVIKLVLWRGSIYFLLFLLLYTADYLSSALENGGSARYLAAAAAAAIFLAQYKLIVCFGLLFLAAEFREKKALSLAALYCGAAGLLLFGAGTVLRTTLPPGGLASFADLGLPGAALFGAVFLSVLAFVSSPRHRRLAGVILAGAGAAAFFSGWTPAGNRPRPVPEWSEVQAWAAANTPVGSLFVTPPYLDGFRVGSARATVFEIKDGAAGVYDARFAFEWWRRANDFGYTRLGAGADMKTEMEKLYNGMDAGRLSALAGRFGAAFVVREGACPPGLAALHGNARFSVCAAGGRGR